MNVKKAVDQRMLVSNKFVKNYVVSTLTAVAVLVSTPAFANTVNTPEKAVSKQVTTGFFNRIFKVTNRKATRRHGKQVYICSPAGFGKKSSCYLR